MKVACADDQWILSIQRSEAQGPFTPPEQRSLAELSKRLSGAVALGRALGFARAEAALASFQASASAAVMYDREGRVLSFNGAAERMLGPDLRVRGRRLVCCDRDATAALNKAIHLLIRERPGSRSEVPVPLPRLGRRPLIAYPMRLSGVTADALNPCQAVVIIVDPDSRLCPTEAALRSSFRLSHAEVNLAVHLGSGQSLDGIADTLGISLETARSQLKSIFSKTGTHRQSELILLLARISSISEATKER